MVMTTDLTIVTCSFLINGDDNRSHHENVDLPKKTPWRETSSIEVDYTAFYSTNGSSSIR
jgi:hypothetical protein